MDHQPGPSWENSHLFIPHLGTEEVESLRHPYEMFLREQDSA